MTFIPYEKVQIKTNLNPFHIREKLSEVIAPVGQTNLAQPFQGKIDKNFLKITRRAADFTPYYPVILGVIQDNIIYFTFRLNFAALFKMILGLCAVATMGFVMWNKQIYLGTVFSILIIIIGYSMSIMYFKTEAKIVRTILEKVLVKG